MNFRRLIFIAGLSFGLFFAEVFAAGAAPGRQMLHSQMPAVVAKLAAAGFLPATNRLHLAIGLPLRNQAALDDFLRQVYDPASPNYRRYLTPEQFTQRFGPTAADYQKVIAFARANGLTVKATYGNRVLLDVGGSVAEIEKAFHVRLRLYQHPRENRKFFAPDVQPSVDLDVPLADVSGLNNYSLPRSKIAGVTPVMHATNAMPKVGGSGPGGTFVSLDFRNAYVPGTPLDGTGQMVGLVQFDGFYSNDIVAYEDLLPGGPRVPLETVLLDGAGGTPGSGNVEVALDIEMAIAMAPGLARVVVFQAPNNIGYFNDILNAMVARNEIKNLSCSWGGGGTNATSESIFQQMAAQGQSFFNASGDSDAFTGSVPFPSESPNITQVGGTTLTMDGLGVTYDSETVWNRGGGIGSSGGISSNYPLPVWQQGIGMTNNYGSTVYRNIPDVALTAEHVYLIYNNGGNAEVGGTSAAAPLWAGFMALVNQQAAAAGRAPIGFINPSVYALATGTNYAGCFHDTTVGDNFWTGSPTNFPATPGYDLCTGWGTPNGTNLINALVGLADTLGITPNSGFYFSGSNGGPFVVTAQVFGLTNSGGGSLDWQLTGTPGWLNVQPLGGSLAVGGRTNVTVSLNTVASNLAFGSYHADLVFSNLTTSVGQLRSVDLVIISPSILENGGFETGDFSGWILVGNGVIGPNIYNAVVNAGSLSDNSGTNFIHSGKYGAFLGDAPEIATLSQTLNTFPGQDYLLSFWLANPVSGAGQQFLVNWNTNSPDVSQIYYVTNPPVLAWTNLTFVLTATDTNTTLQFGAENEQNGFGLDDVTVIPIPAPSFTAFSKTADSFAFTWSSLAGVAYQVQYQTNLLNPDWLVLTNFTAAAGMASFTNAIGSDPERFYRIRRLP